jgi:hypothetical protein
VIRCHVYPKKRAGFISQLVCRTKTMLRYLKTKYKPRFVLRKKNFSSLEYKPWFVFSLRTLILFFGISFYVAPTFAADESTERENKIKIAYLFHFSQFTEWAVKPPVFNYCIYEDAPFSELLKNAYVGKTLGDSRIDVQNITEKSNIDNCQLIYFSNKISADLLTQMRKKPILSVGAQKNILEQGIIYLFEDEQKIRFFINNAAALVSGLKISSQLLSLSKEPQP